MKLIDKARSLSEAKRKMIFWLILIALVLTLVFLWINNAQNKLKSFDLKIPQINSSQ